MRKLLYRLYERSVESKLDQAALPCHVAVMLDGNRRWAEAQGMGRKGKGHLAGAKKTHEFLSWCEQLGIGVVTLYLLSTENLRRRGSEELEELSEIIGSLAEALAAQRRWRIRVVGDGSLLPENLLGRLRAVEASTSEVGDERQLNLAVGYGGRQEISDSIKRILSSHAEAGLSLEQSAELLTPELISEYLYTTGQPDPDLIIRTSGEQRLSGFLLWQSTSSELYFEEALWPDFRKVDFLRALRAYQGRHRRYGA